MTTLSPTASDFRAALPDTSTPLRLAGLDGAVEMHRDRYGIPHVRATTVHDAFFGQGFATAQDRLWQMDCDRRRACGRWAEFAGPSAVAQDRMARRFQLAASARQDYAAVNAEARAMLDAYADGVNAFIGSTRALPVEYAIVGGSPEPWQAWECLAVFKVRHIFMGVFEAKLWRARLVRTRGPERAAALLRGYQPRQLLIVPPGVEYDGPALDGLRDLAEGLTHLGWLEGPEAGSNSWVLSGALTASGKPLLAGDPHRALDTPNVYYQNHVACPEFDIVGLSFPGCPGFPHFGHNARVAWCVTHAGADYQDLYVERFKPGDPRRYESQGKWVEAEVRRESIAVRGAPAVETDVTVTRHGPVVAGDPSSGHAVALKYSATAGPNLGSESILWMLSAGSVEEMDETMRRWVDPCNNLLMADVQGTIGYLTRGQVPIRSMANAWLPVPGWNGEHEWRGNIPFEDLPRLRNPEAGYIVTANNRIVGQDYPYYIALDFAPDYRARRITHRLRALSRATAADMASVHAERVSIPATIYARRLLATRTSDVRANAARATLRGWDGGMDQTSVAASVYSAFRQALHRRVFRGLLGTLAEEALGGAGRGGPGHVRQLAAVLTTAALRGDTTLLPPGTTWDSLAAEALSEAVAELTKRLGNDVDSWQWGRIHRTRPRHPLSDAFPQMAPVLDPPSAPVGGDGDTPQAAGFSTAEPFVVTGTSVARYVFDLADWDASAWVSPLGASGHPGSPHYADQAPIWSRVQLIPMLYDWGRIAAEAGPPQTLSPA